MLGATCAFPMRVPLRQAAFSPRFSGHGGGLERQYGRYNFKDLAVNTGALLQKLLAHGGAITAPQMQAPSYARAGSAQLHRAVQGSIKPVPSV